MLSANILFLGGVPRASALQAALGGEPHFAATPLAAARALAQAHPVAILVEPKSEWARDLVESISPARRPAVVAVGTQTAATSGLADRWLEEDFDERSARRCLFHALMRARFRQKVEGRELLAPATRLLNRRAILHALVRRADRARREVTKLSVVVILIGQPDLPDRAGDEREWLGSAASLIRQGTRRSEVSGRLGQTQFGLIIHGSQKSADGAAARLASKLFAKGIRASFFTHEVDLDDPVRDVHQFYNGRRVALEARAEPPKALA